MAVVNSVLYFEYDRVFAISCDDLRPRARANVGRLLWSSENVSYEWKIDREGIKLWE